MITELERRFLIEVYRACQVEFEELQYEKEWFCTKVLQQIEEALQVLEIRDNAPKDRLEDGFGDPRFTDSFPS